MMGQPRVSIGLPVYNGDRFLAAAIESLLAQSFEDFELLIGDNASTDSTPEICRHYAGLDERIRVHPSTTNIGAAMNFNRLVDLAAGEYFKWAADDDLVAPDFLRLCVAELDRRSDIVLCSSRVDSIDERGAVIGPGGDALDDLDSAAAHRRFANLVLVDHRCIDVFGLIRTDILRASPRIAPYVASDRVLLAELGLRGRFFRVPAVLFQSRDHPGRSINAMPAVHLRAKWFDPMQRGVVFPYWRLFAEYGKLLWRVPLGQRDRAWCHLHLVRWLGVNLNWARMVRDIVIAVTGGAGPLRRRTLPGNET